MNASDVASSLLRYLNANNIFPDEPEPGRIFHFPVAASPGWGCFTEVDTEPLTLKVVCLSPVAIPVHRTDGARRLINTLNRHSPFGCWSMAGGQSGPDFRFSQAMFHAFGLDETVRFTMRTALARFAAAAPALAEFALGLIDETAARRAILDEDDGNSSPGIPHSRGEFYSVHGVPAMRPHLN